MTVRIKVDTERFARALAGVSRQTGDNVDTVVRSVALAVLSRIVQTWPVDTGVSRAQWTGPHKRGHAHYVLQTSAPYAETIEFGLYRGVGPRTEALGAVPLGNGLFVVASGVFSTQAHAPVRRALAEAIQSLERQLAGAVRRAWKE